MSATGDLETIMTDMQEGLLLMLSEIVPSNIVELFTVHLNFCASNCETPDVSVIWPEELHSKIVEVRITPIIPRNFRTEREVRRWLVVIDCGVEGANRLAHNATAKTVRRMVGELVEGWAPGVVATKACRFAFSPGGAGPNRAVVPVQR